jgi:hypothetical protein
MGQKHGDPRQDKDRKNSSSNLNNSYQLSREAVLFLYKRFSVLVKNSNIPKRKQFTEGNLVQQKQHISCQLCGLK